MGRSEGCYSVEQRITAKNPHAKVGDSFTVKAGTKDSGFGIGINRRQGKI
jgi:hypothetical protein